MEKKKKVFAEGICFTKLFWVFIIGCVLGTVYETILSRFQFGEWQSRRGLIYGPFNPVYGAGMALGVLALHRVRSLHKQIIYGAVLGGGFEYVVWALQKALFNSCSWNYKSPFTFNGQPIFTSLYWGGTSLFHALGWGILLTAMMRILWPIVNKGIEKIPNGVGKPLTSFMILFFCFNVLITAVALKRQQTRHDCESGVTTCYKPNAIEEFLDTYYSDEILYKVYPNMDLGGGKNGGTDK